MNIDEYIGEIAISSILKKYIIQRDYKHEENVKRIALSIFDNLRTEHNMTQSDRNLLSCGCLLHDIGYFINKSDHHNHSAYIILNDELFDVLPSALRSDLALLCQNHRKSSPKNIDHFDLNKRKSFLKLIAILRIADGLDHELVQNILFESNNEKNSNMKIYLKSSYNHHFIKKLTQKSILFNEIFNTNLFESLLVI